MGRIGPLQMQDWYRGLIKTARLLSRYTDAEVVIISAVQVASEDSEADAYLRVLQHLGVPSDRIRVIRKGYETIEQLTVARELMETERRELVIISTFLHYPRVRWIARGLRATHHAAFGLPRPTEAVTDILLAVLFPLIDLAGGRAWFMHMVQRRRMAGKH